MQNRNSITNSLHPKKTSFQKKNKGFKRGFLVIMLNAVLIAKAKF